MTRQQIINKLIIKNNYKRYLEVGVQLPSSCFDTIECSYKQGIEPFPNYTNSPYNSNIHIKTSDEYFHSIKETDEKFDIVFIDGLHHNDQVIKDIENSLRHLDPNGTIVCHDCLPSNENQQERNDHGGVWLGDVWKAIAHFRITRNDIKIEVVNTDLGCGIITKQPSIVWDTKGEKWDNWSYFKNNSQYLMNVISVGDFNIKYL